MEFLKGTIAACTAIGLIMGIIFLPFWLWPKYRLYSQDLNGQANLRQQEWEKRILVEQARAENDSANLKAEARVKQAVSESEAEVARSRGVAEANKIIQDSLQGNEAYLRYLWIDKLSDKSVIYVPTEAGLPLLEAGKR